MQTPIEVANRWFSEVWNQRNLSVIADLMAPDARGHLEGPIEIVGPKQFLEFQKEIFDVLPDINVKIIHWLSDGDVTAVMWEATAMDQKLTFRGTSWFRIVEGKIVEGWDCWDRGGLTAKLSAIGTSR